MRRTLLLVVLLAVACKGRGPQEELLAPQIPVARKLWSGTLIEFGSPRALPHLSEAGWSLGETAPDGNTFRWAVDEASSFTFTSDREGDTIAWLECEPFVYEGSPAQWIALSVNGEKIRDLELRPGRESYPVELPVLVGDNTVSMQFRYWGDPHRSSADRRRLAVAFYRFDIPPEGEALVAGRTGAFSWTSEGLHLPAGGSVALYANVDGDARLQVTTSGPGVNVTIQSDDHVALDETLAEAGAWERDVEADGLIEIALEAERDVDVRPTLYRSTTAPPKRPPQRVDANVVLVFLDGANALRMSASTTPVLDGLAREALVYETAVSQAVYTIASIGSVLTSQYPERHQSVTFADKLGDDVVTFPALLSANGYRTAGFSGNAVASKTFGLDRGYEEFFQIWERDDYTGHGESVLDAFRDWLGRVGDDRFFAYVHFREPHFPYNPPAPFDTQFGASELFPEGMADWGVVEAMNSDAAAGVPPSEEVVERVRALYEGNFAYVDDLVGQLIRCLEDRGIVENTVLIVTADHGEALFEHGYIGHNTQLYEESVRVPLLVKLPGRAPRRVEDLVELIDVAPTILELAGIPIPETMQGTSLFAVREDPIAFTRTVWKRARYSVRDDRFKLIWDSRTGDTELYDLDTDPMESRDLVSERPFVSGYLEQRLFFWLRDQEALRGRTGSAQISDDERRKLEALGYTNVLEEKRR